MRRLFRKTFLTVLVALACFVSSASPAVTKPSTLSKSPSPLASTKSPLEQQTCTTDKNGAQTCSNGGAIVSTSFKDRIVVGGYFALWYALNVYYNSTFHLFLLDGSMEDLTLPSPPSHQQTSSKRNSCSNDSGFDTTGCRGILLFLFVGLRTSCSASIDPGGRKSHYHGGILARFRPDCNSCITWSGTSVVHAHCEVT